MLTKESAIKRVTLFANTSGTFSSVSNYSLSGNSSSSIFNVTGLADGAYLWNCKFFDTSDNLTWFNGADGDGSANYVAPPPTPTRGDSEFWTTSGVADNVPVR